MTNSMPSTAEISQSRSAEAQPIALNASHRREQFIAFALFLFSLAYLSIFRRHCSFEPDEGIVLQGAERILRGQVPYRDFFTFYTPGSFYLVASLFHVFGDSFVIARTSLALAGAICSLITFLLARRVCPLGTALFAGVLATIAGCAYRFLVLHNWYSTLLCCLCLYAAVRFLENRRIPWIFSTGFLASLAFLFEQSKGAGLLFGLALAWTILAFVAGISVVNMKGFVAFSAGFTFPFLSTFVYFSAEHALGQMLESWLWPLRHYGEANHVPYGWQNWSQDTITEIFRSGPLWLRVIKVLTVSPGIVAAILPLISLALLIYWSRRLRSRALALERAAYYVSVCSVCAGLLLSIVIARADVIHFMYLAPLWYVVLAWILASPARSRLWESLRACFAVYVVAAFGLLALALLLNATGARARMQTSRGTITMSKADSALAYLQSHTAPKQPLVVYPYLPLYNYLTATLSPARYDYFQPGLNTPDQAREIIASLQSSPDASVLFEPWFAEKIANSWPETPLSAIANDPVSDYLAKNYRVCKLLVSSDNDAFEYMVSKDRVCP